MHGTGDLMGSVQAFDEALKLDANNAQAKSGKAAVERASEQEARADGIDPSGGLGNMFNDPKLHEKLAANPKTSGLLGDAQFMQKLNNMKSNPQGMQQEMFSDPRFLQVMSRDRGEVLELFVADLEFLRVNLELLFCDFCLCNLISHGNVLLGLSVFIHKWNTRGRDPII